MKETSAIQAIHGDIVLIQTTLADMTFAQFISLPISRLMRLTKLLSAANSDEQFEVTFAKSDVFKSREYACSPKKCEQMKLFMPNDEAYADWCYAKFRLRVKNCMFKIRQMLEGVNFDNAEISAARMRLYQKLYNVVSNSGVSLVDRRAARAAAQTGKK